MHDCLETVVMANRGKQRCLSEVMSIGKPAGLGGGGVCVWCPSQCRIRGVRGCAWPGRGKDTACPVCIQYRCTRRGHIRVFSGRFSCRRGAKMCLGQTPKSSWLWPATGLHSDEAELLRGCGTGQDEGFSAHGLTKSWRTREVAPGFASGVLGVPHGPGFQCLCPVVAFWI